MSSSSTAFKKIKDYTPTELDEAVVTATKYCDTCGFNFYPVLNGIDAYFERRRRKEEAEENARFIKRNFPDVPA